MVSLLQTKSILKTELLLIRLLDRTFQRACDLRTLDYKTELPRNVKKEFGKNIFALQFDKLITEIIKESGDLYSLRYDELLMFISRGFEERLKRLEEK